MASDAPIDQFDYAFYERIAARTARETAATCVVAAGRGARVLCGVVATG